MLKQIPKLTLPLVAFLLLFQISFAQRTITGRITDAEGAGVPGVTVTVRGTNTATQTGADGSYTITAPDNATLVMTAVGYTTQEVSAGNAEAVTLQTNASNLNEVVVVGYGTARRRDVTGSVATVRAKDFNKGVIVSPEQAIQGKAAGVMVINNSGQPGGSTTIRIRGTSSIRSGNQPLFVVDGVPLSGTSARPNLPGANSSFGSTDPGNPLNFLNPNDFASIEILKDASATAIYGSRGANGVILITTKRGQTGSPTIDVSASAGTSTILKRLEVLNAQEYVKALGDYGFATSVYTSANPTANFGSSVNAMDAILRTGYTQNYYVGIGGGNENAKFRISAGYLDQQGIIKNSDFKKYTASVNSLFTLLDNRRLTIDFKANLAGTREQAAPISNSAGFAGNLIGQALQWNPTHALIKPGTDSAWIDPAVGSTTINPLVMLQSYDDRPNVSTILATITPSYKLTDNLEYRFQYSLNSQHGSRRVAYDRRLNVQGIEGRGFAGILATDLTGQQFTNTLNYNNEISSNLNLNAVIGHEYLKYDFRGTGMAGENFTDAGLAYYDYLQYTTQTSRGIFSFASPIQELQSYFGRAIVNYLDKYLLTATLRADGSSKFGANNRYGYFPSLALAWVASNEDFLKGNSVVNNLKLRASWGKTGNQEFAGGASLARYSFGQQSISQQNFPNPDLKWETSTISNIGADYSLFNDRFFGFIDYFYKKTTDVLFEQDVIQPGPAGPKYWINLPGNIVNNGLEVSLNAGIVRSRDINWNAGVNLSFLQNKVEGINGYYETGALHGQGISGARSQRLVSGQPLNVYYLRRFEGIDKTSGQSIYTDDGNTLFYSGSPNPTMLLGFSTDFNYKKFTATVNMNGTFGHLLYNNTLNTILPIGNLGTRNIAKSLLNTGVKENASNPIAPSTRYLEKGDYVKLANATITYALGNIGKGLRNANISLTGQNLFVITKFSGFDPEVNTDKSVAGIPSLGIEYTPYPTARTILLGISFSL